MIFKNGIPDDYNEHMKRCRLEKNMTPQQLANKSHVTKATILKWENGESVPRLDLFFLVCDALNIDPEVYIGRK